MQLQLSSLLLDFLFTADIILRSIIYCWRAKGLEYCFWCKRRYVKRRWWNLKNYKGRRVQSVSFKQVSINIYTINFKFSPNLSFLTLTTFYHSGLFLQNELLITIIFHIIKFLKHTPKNIAFYWCNMLHWFYNNNMKSQSFNSFSKKKKIFLKIQVSHLM